MQPVYSDGFVLISWTKLESQFTLSGQLLSARAMADLSTINLNRLITFVAVVESRRHHDAADDQAKASAW
jgi:hypothetical protein